MDYSSQAFLIKFSQQNKEKSKELLDSKLLWFQLMSLVTSKQIKKLQWAQRIDTTICRLTFGIKMMV